MTPKERAEKIVAAHPKCHGKGRQRIADAIQVAIESAESAAEERGARRERERCYELIHALPAFLGQWGDNVVQAIHRQSALELINPGAPPAAGEPAKDRKTEPAWYGVPGFGEPGEGK